MKRGRRNATAIVLAFAFFAFTTAFTAADEAFSRERGRSDRIPTVTAERLTELPLISNKTSEFLYNYNCANFPRPPYPRPSRSRPDGGDCLAVRVQNLAPNAKSIYDVGPSFLALSCGEEGSGVYSKVRESDVFASSSNGFSSFAVEDPRISVVPFEADSPIAGSYALFYTNVSRGDDGALLAQLSLATLPFPSFPKGVRSEWRLHGNVFPSEKWSKSGALLPRGREGALLFWGDANLSIAVSSDYLHFDNTGKQLLETRQDFFDSALVEAGRAQERPTRLLSFASPFYIDDASLLNLISISFLLFILIFSLFWSNCFLSSSFTFSFL